MEMDGYSGILHGLGASTGTPCQIVPRGDGLEARVNQLPQVVVPYNGMTITVSGMEDRYLCFDGVHAGARVQMLTSEKQIAGHIVAIGAPRQIVDQLEKAAKLRGRHAAGRWSIFLGLGGIVGLIVLLVVLAFNWAAGAIVAQIPSEWEGEIGRSGASEILGQQSVCSDAELNNAVGEIGRRLVMGMGETRYDWKVRVLDSEDVNAFALPGGYVFVNRGLIESSDDGYQVAGVLAHEFQHVILRHGIRNMVREIGLMVILYAVVGDAGAAERFLVGNAANLASMSFSRDQEEAADAEGMALVYKAGLEPTGLIRFMKTLAQEEGVARSVLTVFLSHPASEDRADRLQGMIDAWGPAPVVPLTANWSDVKGRCGAVQIKDPDQI